MWPFKKAKPPDGTYRIESPDGTVSEGWADPKKLSALLRKAEQEGKAKHLVKVLIKGPWEGVKEDYWVKSEVNAEPDENGCIYAFCVFINGEPKYNLLHKKLWDRFDEVLAITSDPNLSSDEKAKQLKKMAE